MQVKTIKAYLDWKINLKQSHDLYDIQKNNLIAVFLYLFLFNFFLFVWLHKFFIFLHLI